MLIDDAVKAAREFRNNASEKLFFKVKDEVMAAAIVGKLSAQVCVGEFKESHIQHVSQALSAQGFSVLAESLEGKIEKITLSWNLFK